MECSQPLSNNSEFLIDWDDLFFDLKNERAILILGPEFHSRHELSLRGQLFNELTKKSDHGIIHFYPNNGIFLFKSAKYKTQAQKIASEFFKSIEADSEILQKIIELPFRMVINTTPDKSLLKMYKKNDLECQFDYFRWSHRIKDKNPVKIKAPSNLYPLIFNLFGSVDSFESIVLDFEDIYSHLSSLLNNQNVDKEIRTVLNETDTYIFIGFHLEKWDTQLLFRYLNMKENDFDDTKKNYTTKSLDIDVSSESFFRQQFNLKYYGVPVDFINQMHQKYMEQYTKPDTDTDFMQPNERVERYLSFDEIEQALNYLTIYLKDKTDVGASVLDDLIIIKGNYTRYKKKDVENLESKDSLEMTRARIKQSILNFIKSI